MEPKKFKSPHGPEFKIQTQFIKYLEMRGWGVQRMAGGMFQFGVPDLYIFHKHYGSRWVDLKVAGRYSWTKAQRVTWPYWAKMGVGIWIITAADDTQYNLLFGPPNVMDFWKESFAVSSRDEILKELYEK